MPTAWRSRSPESSLPPAQKLRPSRAETTGHHSLLVFLLALGLALSLLTGTAGAHLRPSPSRDAQDVRVRTRDHFVPHESTVPANAGQKVKLFVRERVARGRDRPPTRGVVLFVPGCCTPVVPGFDLRFQDYSWMGYLAEVGFDVFALDPTGFGLSPRPTMDDPCNVDPAQQHLLVPNPLSSPCEPTYPFRLATSQSDWDEIDTVVKYVQHLRGVDRVSLIGWSSGGATVGAYAVEHPDKVDRLVLFAPTYDRDGRDLSELETSVPQPGFPTTVRTRARQVGWAGVTCDDQVDPEILEPIWDTTMAFDPVGQQWGPPEGLMRIRTATSWGWNQAVASRVRAPTLVIVGDSDMSVQERPRDLFEDLKMPDKVFVEVGCASHFMMWERQHRVLQRLSAEWLGQ